MPTKRKTNSTAVHHQPKKALDVYGRIVSLVWVVAAFIMAVVFVTSMSGALAAVSYGGAYERQEAIGSQFINGQNYVIETAVATSTFVAMGANGRTATIQMFQPNILSFQTFVSTSTSSTALVDVNSYGCAQKFDTSSDPANTLFYYLNVQCFSYGPNDIIPPVGSRVLVRYYYVRGTPLFPMCGNFVVDHGETCDDGYLNGTPGHCNATCDGMIPTSTPRTTLRVPTPPRVQIQQP